MAIELKSNQTLPIRLDRFLRQQYPNLTQGIIEKALRKGLIKLNSKKAISSARIVLGDLVSIADHLAIGLQEEGERSFPYSVIELAEKIISSYLLYPENIENADFIAINKPEGLAVQGGSKINLSIDDALAYLNYTHKKNYKLVHRLDKDTSGVLLIAANQDAAVKLGEAFAEGLIEKTYIATVSGCPKKIEGTMSNYIGKERSGQFEIVKELSEEEGGRLAITNYKVISSDGDRSVIEYRPLTGRMHQLRLHSQLLGCPILGDMKYGNTKAARMFLHAKSLKIPRKVFGKEIVIRA